MEAADSRLLLQRLHDGELGEPWCFHDGLLVHGRHIFVPAHGDLRHRVLLLAHATGHEGTH